MRETVGNIQGYDVIYIPEKQTLFCKNKDLELEKLWEENEWNKSTVCIEI